MPIQAPISPPPSRTEQPYARGEPHDKDSEQVDPQRVTRIPRAAQGVHVDRADDQRNLEDGQQLERRDADLDHLRIAVHEGVDRPGGEKVNDRHRPGQEAALKDGGMSAFSGTVRVARPQGLSDHGGRRETPGVGRQVRQRLDADPHHMGGQRDLVGNAPRPAGNDHQKQENPHPAQRPSAAAGIPIRRMRATVSPRSFHSRSDSRRPRKPWA